MMSPARATGRLRNGLLVLGLTGCLLAPAAQAGENAFMSGVVLINESGQFCQAVKVSARKFLTAGHCARDIQGGPGDSLRLAYAATDMRPETVVLAAKPAMHPSYLEKAEKLDLTEFPGMGWMFEEIYMQVLDLGLIELKSDTPYIPIAVMPADPPKPKWRHKLSVATEYDCGSGNGRSLLAKIEAVSDNLLHLSGTVCRGTSGGAILASDGRQFLLVAITGASGSSSIDAVRLDSPKARRWLNENLP
jgi:hypothetical protein